MIGSGAAHRIDGRTGLEPVTRFLLIATTVVGACHHVDHVLRVDHSGWPFLPQVTPFTFSLTAYPILAFALFGPARLFWLRWSLLFAGAGFTLFAHAMIESPAMQYAMWAYNRSLEPELWSVRNLCGVRSGPLGIAAVIVSMALNVLLVTTAIAMLANGLRNRRGAARPAGG
jgi:hypothetical protein